MEECCCLCTAAAAKTVWPGNYYLERIQQLLLAGNHLPASLPGQVCFLFAFGVAIREPPTAENLIPGIPGEVERSYPEQDDTNNG